MARVTVEDCVDKINNRFELVLFSAHRTRVIGMGAECLVERDNDKDTVIALREVAESKISPEDLRETFLQSLQPRVENDEQEKESYQLLQNEADILMSLQEIESTNKK